MRRWKRKAPKPGDRIIWASLTWILFFSIVLVMFAVFLAVQFLGILPEAESLHGQIESTKGAEPRGSLVNHYRD